MRDYIIRPRAADLDKGPDGEAYLAREIIETVETIDIGLTDQFGNKDHGAHAHESGGLCPLPGIGVLNGSQSTLRRL